MRHLLLALITIVIFPHFCANSVAQTEPAPAQPSVDAAQIAPMSQDDLPDSTLRGDLLAVVVLDLSKGDKTAWTNTWMVISGGSPTTRPVPDDAALPIGLEQSLGPIFRMGAERVIYSVTQDGFNQDITLGFRLRQGTSETAADKWLRQNIGAAARFDHDGSWLITRLNARNGAMAPSGELSPLAEQVREELNCWGDVPIKAVYPNPSALKKALGRNGQLPSALAGMANLFWAAKYVYFGAELGAEPQVEMRWVAPDEAGADAAITEFSNMRQQLKVPSNGTGIPLPLVQVMDQFHPIREGNVARIALNKKDLSSVFTAVLVASMGGGGQAQQTEVHQSHIDSTWKPMDATTDSASSQMRLILSAIAEYDEAHQALPGTLNDLVTDGLMPGPEIFHDPRTGQDNGFVYVRPDGVGKMADITSRDKTAILFEVKDGKPDEAGLVGYADGHVGNGQ
jgi:hypothetical protein